MTAVLPLVAPLWAQDTTGRIVVRALDPVGAAVPGVAVTVASPSLIGAPRTEVTDRHGEARHVSLPPGLYAVTAFLPGHVIQGREQVKVPLGGAAVLQIRMGVATFAGEIEVRAETPVVDPTRVASEQVLDREYLRGTAVGGLSRFYAEPVNQVAGVRPTGLYGSRVMGSTPLENAWYIDGMNASSPSNAMWGPTVVFDAVDEVKVSTAGFEAAEGRALGAVVNVVTRSGGNDLAGTLDARYQDPGFHENGDHYDRGDQEEHGVLVDGTLGGPVVRDHLWFFTALQWGEDRLAPVGSPVDHTREITLGMAKLTWQAGSSWRATGSINRAHAAYGNFNASRLITAEAAASRDHRWARLTFELDGVLGEDSVFNLRGGRYAEGYDTGPTTGDVTAISHLDLSSGVTRGSYSYVYRHSDSRTELATRVIWFTEGLGRHEIGFGAELSRLASDSSDCSTGRLSSSRCEAGTVGLSFDDVEVAGAVIPYRMWEEVAPGAIDSTGELWSAHLQDSWRPVPAVTVKVGLRWDRAVYDNDAGRRIADLALWQPRVGVAWDVVGDGHTVARASLGRYMDPKTMVLPSYVATGSPTSRIWLSCAFAGAGLVPGVDPFDPELCEALAGDLEIPWRTDPEGWDPHGWLLVATQSERPPVTEQDLRPAFADHLVLSVERELFPRTSLELSWVSKRTERLMEDTCDGALMSPAAGHGCSRVVVANIPGLERSWDAAILRLESRALDWLSVHASYTWSESKGNVESQLSAYDYDYYPWHWANRDGYLSDHRRHTLKLNGYLLLPRDVSVTVDGGWQSAFRWTPRATPADEPGMPYGERFLEPRGSRSGEDEWWLDLELAKGFRVSAVRLVGIVSMQNLASAESTTQVCQRLSGCGGAELGEAIRWQLPRRWEVGLRVEF